MPTIQNDRLKKQLTITLLAVLTAGISFVPLRTLGLEITFTTVPIAVGAILFGPIAGGILGCVFGLCSFFQCFGYSAFGAALLSLSWWRTLLVCLPTRILMGLLAGLISQAMRRLCERSRKPWLRAGLTDVLVGSVVTPIMNTVFFMSTLVLYFWNAEIIQSFAAQLGTANPIIFIFLFTGINGLVEIICGIVIAFPVAKGVQSAIRHI